MSTTQYALIASVRPMPNSTRGVSWHYALVSDILVSCPNTLIQRVQLKGDNNATVDHAHALTDISGKTCHVVLNTLHHAWELPTEAVRALHLRVEPKVGAASIFNQYMPS